MRARAQYLLGAQVIRHQVVGLQRSGPLGSLEDLAVGNIGDVGVDQRSAAETRTLYHGDVTVIENLIKAQRIQARTKLWQHFLDLVREGSDGPFFAALQDANGGLLGRIRQARGGDCSAVARTDHYEIV